MAVSTAPMASGASGVPPRTARPIVRTRKNVPMNSVRYWRMSRVCSAPGAHRFQVTSDTAMTPVVGDSVSHYQIVRTLGSGGMGVVYEAEYSLRGRRVALKFLTEGMARDAGSLERFQRYARAA